MMIKCEVCGKETNFAGYDPDKKQEVCLECYTKVLRSSEQVSLKSSREKPEVG